MAHDYFNSVWFNLHSWMYHITDIKLNNITYDFTQCIYNFLCLSTKDVAIVAVVSAVASHLTCNGINYLVIVNLKNLFNNLSDLLLPPSKSSLPFKNMINNNFKILHTCKHNNSDRLLSLEILTAVSMQPKNWHSSRNQS